MSSATVLSEDLAPAYTFVFLALGQAALFGGLCVPFSDIPALFQPAYHSSIPALTCAESGERVEKQKKGQHPSHARCGQR